MKTIVEVDNEYQVVSRKIINEKEIPEEKLDIIIPVFKKEVR